MTVSTRPLTNSPPAGYRPISDQLAIAPTVSVVIPAMNEAENLPYVFATLPSWLNEVVLVDGHSTDDTIAVARSLWPDLVVVPQSGRGKGNALVDGFEACSGDIIVMVDADGSADGEEILSYVCALVAGADFAKGSRFVNGGATDDMTLLRKLGNRFLTSAVNAKFGARYTDLCYGYNAFWRSCLPKIELDAPGFEIETLMNIRVQQAGLRVQEVPSRELCRIHGDSNLHTFRDGLRVLRVILRESALRNREPRNAPKARLSQPTPPHSRTLVCGLANVGNQARIARPNQLSNQARVDGELRLDGTPQVDGRLRHRSPLLAGRHETFRPHIHVQRPSVSEEEQ